MKKLDEEWREGCCSEARSLCWGQVRLQRRYRYRASHQGAHGASACAATVRYGYRAHGLCVHAWQRASWGVYLYADALVLTGPPSGRRIGRGLQMTQVMAVTRKT